jgi:hypothetical protein
MQSRCPGATVRVVVDAGAGCDNGVQVVEAWPVDRPTLGMDHQGLACSLLQRKRWDGIDDSLLQSPQSLGRLDDDPHQAEPNQVEIGVSQIVEG